MKNLLESFAILLVGLLSLSIVYLIVQYNMIDDENTIEDIASVVPQKKKETTKEKTTNYLDNLEGYEDVDVEVDATKEDLTNTVMVKSELTDDELGAAVEDKSKSSYMENLENYSEPAKEEKPAETKEAEPVPDNSGEPVKLEQEEIVDEIGMAIDAALDDL